MISAISEEVEKNFNGCFKIITEDNVYNGPVFLDSVVREDDGYYIYNQIYSPSLQDVDFRKEKILRWYRIIFKLVKK